MTKAYHKTCVASGAVMLLLMGLGLVLAHIVPAPSPTQTDTTVAQFYADHQIQVRIGLIITLFGVSCMGLFVAAVVREVQQMSGGRQTTAANVQLIFGIMNMVQTYIPFLFFQGVAFRPDRPAAITQALNDTAWMLFIACVSTVLFQMGALSYSMLTDKRANPTFPRWFAYYTLFVACDIVAGGFVVLTKTGPFAWNGLLAYYFPFATWGAWCVGMVIFMSKSLDREFAATGKTADAGSDTDARFASLTSDIDSRRSA